VNERIIVIEQRLRTTGVATAIATILFIFVGVALGVDISDSSNSLPVAALVAEAIALFALIYSLLMSLRIVVRVVEAPEGRTLEIVYGPAGLVRQIFGPERIVAVSAGNFSFTQMGGWGYRGSLKLLHRAALVTRRGDALDVQLRGKRRFIVTVDAPQDFVKALALPTP
jgi:hypothetical protein